MAKLPRSGISSFSIDGVPYDVASDVTWQPDMLVKETLVGMTGVQDFGATPKQGKISVTIRDDGGISIQDFAAMNDVTVVIVCRNGKSILGNDMWQVGEIEVDTKEATFKLDFEGADVSEVSNG